MCYCNNRCDNSRQRNDCGCDREPVVRRRFDCCGTRQVIKHEHIVKHRHDIVNEYDVIHEHDYNYYDVVRERNVVRHHDHTNHNPDYCCDRNRNGRGRSRGGNGNGFGGGDNEGGIETLDFGRGGGNNARSGCK